MIHRPLAGVVNTIALLALFIASTAHADDGVVIVRDNRHVAPICITIPAGDTPAAPGNAKPARGKALLAELSREAIDSAVKELTYHVQQMSGASLEVLLIEDASKIPTPAIVLGEHAVKLGATPTKTSESKEGFRILVKDGRVLIGGESDDAVLFGAMELLRRLGCDWVMPGAIGEIIPKRGTVTVPAMDVAQAPDFAMRRLWYRGYRTKEHPALPGESERFVRWLRRHKGGTYSAVVGQTAGHAWDQFINRHKAEFEADPSMLALRRDRDGTMKRMGPQLEAVNPKVAQLMADDIKAVYAKNIAEGKWTRETAAGFPIGPADGLGYSQSPEAIAANSGATDPTLGEADQTDLVVLLGNRVLEIVHKEYPNAHVGFYSYSVHGSYPRRYTPNAKMGVIFAPIAFSRYHSVTDENSPTQAIYRKVVEQWGSLARTQGNPLMYRGYNWNLAENYLPYTKVRIWGEEIPFYKRMNMQGLNVEATKQWATLGASDYIFMRLAWDSSQYWRALLREFCEHSYGKGAAAMQQYHLALADRQRDARQEAGSYHAFHLMYDDVFVASQQKLIDAALAAADTDADKQRIGFVNGSNDALRLYLAYHKATREFDFVETKKRFDAMCAQWTRMYEQNSDLVSNEAMGYFNRFIKSFVDEGLKFSSEPYKLMHRIPDALPTMLDAKLEGEAKSWFDPKLDDSSWKPTKTFTSTWDAQGLMFQRAGGVWYRHRFTLPPEAARELKGKPIGLFAGGFEDEMRVWLNGQPIGTSGVRFSKPAEFDLTDAISADGENVLVMQVIRNSVANELGLGGILRPCYLFTGPKLETRAPKPMPDRRVLPGGELGGE